MSTQPTSLILCLGVLLGFAATTLEGHAQQKLRTWTSGDGRTLEASLVTADGEKAVLELKGGREVEVQLDQLSEADRKHIAELEARGLTVRVGRMPAETAIDNPVKVEGGPSVFTTEHFEFHTDQKVSKAFISEACRVYEGTYEAISQLPIGLKMRPPQDMDRFRGLFMNQRNFNAKLVELGMGSSLGGRTRIAGVYSPRHKELLVPYDSLGARDSGSQKTLRKSSDTSTLVHEVVHQVMHDYLPLIPVWFSEGISEYLNAVPYQNGRFEFKNLKRGLKEHLERKYRHEDDDWIEMYHPEDIIGQMIVDWPGSMDSYRDSMLMFHFFMHLDRSDAVGAPVAAFLKVYDPDDFNPDTFINDYNKAVDEYRKREKEYNQEVEIYNSALESYREAEAKYNALVAKANREATQGVPADKRTPVPAAPKAPVPPKDIVVPEILLKNQNGIVGIIKTIREKGNKILLRDRSYEELAASIKAAYAEAGYHIEFREPGAWRTE